MKKKIKMSKFIDTLNLKVLYLVNNYVLMTDTSDILRPGLQMSGFFEHFASNRVQLFGMSEMTYIANMEKNRQVEVFEKYFSYPMPCVLISRDLQPPK